MNYDIPTFSGDDIAAFCSKYGVDELSAKLLLRRDITGPESLKYFLNDDLRTLHNPFLFKQMDLMVDRIQSAVSEGEKVLVFGDRDTDGITATVLMVEALRGMGLEVFWEVPMGDEHYGIQREIIERFAALDVSLLITVDNGIGNIDEMDFANSLGMDSLIIDHHNPGEYLPDSIAIVNPKVEEDTYPFEGLSAVALVAKVLMALDIAKSDFYNQVFCFLNVRPGNDSIIVEAVKLSNMVETHRITETFIDGSSEAQLSRLVDFIRDQAIFVYQGDSQRKLLARLFGQSVDIALTDIADQIWSEFPALKNRSLLRMLQGSKLSKFSSREPQEIDAAVQLLISYLYARHPAILSNLSERLDLVTLGLIADMMPLRDENRIMIRHGMNCLENTKRPGLRELLARLGLLGKPLSSQGIGWKLTPSLNATGRMGQPDIAVKLLLGEGDVSQLAGQIFDLNERRKQLGAEAWNAVLPAAQDSLDAYNGNLAVVRHESIHRGITGILASRLSRSFDVPAFVLADLGAHIVGSVRSTRGFHVTDFLTRFEDLLDDFGGHDAAGGFHLDSNRLGEFLDRLKQQSATIELGGVEEPDIDLELNKAEFTENLEAFQQRLEPVGMDFPVVSYLVRDLVIENASVIGKDQNHLRLLLSSGSRKWPAVYWSAAERFNRDFTLGSRVHCSFTLDRNFFGGNSNLQLTIIDMANAQDA